MPESNTSSKASVILGAVLAAVSLFCLASIALAWMPGAADSPLTLPGAVLRGSFAWAAFFVPLWFGCASILAFLPGFRPFELVCLAFSVFPFLPLAFLARVSSSPELWFDRLPVLEATGLPALALACVAAFLFLSAAVALAANALARIAASPPLEAGKAGRGLGFRPSLLPSPRELASHPTGPEDGPARGQGGAEPSFPSPDTNATSESEAASVGTDQLVGTEHFDFRVPRLEPLPAMHTIGAGGDRPLAAGGDRPAPRATAAVAGGDRPASGAAPQDEAVELEELEDADGALDEASTGGTSLVELAGSPPIEFTSVPPHAAAAGALKAGPTPEEAEKEAALARILARRAEKRKDKPYAVPVENILATYPDGQYWIIDEKTKRSAEVLRDTLAEFNIEAEVTGIRKGPVITMFEILPAPGVKLSKITNLADNIALRLAASSVRIVAPIPGKHAVGIEVPNEKRAIVSLREIVEAEDFKSAKMEIPVALGKDIAGGLQFIDLVQTPHLLIAGTTGSGKSVCVNSIILSILLRRSPQDVKLLLIDPKIVELKLFNDIPHLLTPVITEPKRAFQALQYCICEMERRYTMLDRVGVRDVKAYNRKIKEKGLVAEHLPNIVVIIDEFADLMATTGKELESTLARLAAMSRAVGLHLVLATQRPSIDVITGLIKANIPSRIAFMVAGKFDSRIIIDMVGAEKLLGRGDMLFASAWDPFPVRIQGAFVSDEEVEKAVEFVKTLGEPEYIDDEIFIDEEDEEGEQSLFGDEDDDPLFEKALEIVLQQGRASASYIQRRLKIGYNRASRLVELMEEKGIVGPAKGSKPRDLVHNPEVLGRASASPNARGAEAGRQPSLMPDLETVPGQRVTGRDEDAGGDAGVET